MPFSISSPVSKTVLSFGSSFLYLVRSSYKTAVTHYGGKLNSSQTNLTLTQMNLKLNPFENFAEYVTFLSICFFCLLKIKIKNKYERHYTNVGLSYMKTIVA